MTINLALEYIPRRMEELGYGRAYHMRFRHFVLQPLEVIDIIAYNQFFILIEPSQDVTVESDFGIFDISQSNTNEMIYEHQGEIKITNLASLTNHVRCIQVFPKPKENGKDSNQ